MAKVSIIVPVYNVEKYLSRCLDSILNQTFTDFEVILVNDCSPDNSGAICDEYAKKDNRIKVIHRGKNGGASASRNMGLEASGGEYISFVDSDDYVIPKYLETLVWQLETNDADVVQCGFCEVVNDVMSDITQQHICETYTKEQAYGLLYGNGSANKLNFILWNKLFRKSLVKDVKFVEGLRCEDVIYVSESIAGANKIVYNSEQMYYYSRHEDSVMGIMQSCKEDMVKSHILAYRQVSISVENLSEYITLLSNARLAVWYVSAIKNKMLKKDKELKKMFKEDKKRFAFLKNKRIPFIKRLVIALRG